MVIYNLFLAEFSLKHAAMEMVDELGGICAACYFKSGSNVGGCAIKIQNDETGTIFNISHVDEIDFECFSVAKAGVFSVSVYEVRSNGTLGHEVIRLPDITVRLPEVTSAKENSMGLRGENPGKKVQSIALCVGIDPIHALFVL